jgi:hypothetical protein
VAQVAEGVASLFSDAARQQQVDAFFANYKVRRACLKLLVSLVVRVLLGVTD